eukprot:GEMP01045239.1.p1 GENE.GEMP01045239.1~~GEMP01045239.1.p1  ORF type:complete len:419 (+),score=84.63 GEMP01045239.1:46-1302(+)
MSFKPYNAYIVAALRTPGGKRNGLLSGYHPADLGATVIDALIEQTGIDGGQIDDVVFGCVSQIGAQSSNIARNVVLACKNLPESVPGTTVDRQCGSSQQALHFAAQAVMSGTQDVVIAGGVEVMSLVPIGSNAIAGMQMGHGIPISENIGDKYNKQMSDGYDTFEINNMMFSQFGGAEMLAKKYQISREEADAFALLSQQRAAAATKEGKFKKELVPVKCKVNEKFKGKEVPAFLTYDEGIRHTTKESLQKLRPLHKNGILTAGNASQITDGASVCLIVNENGLKKLGLKPRLLIKAMAVVGADPVVMLEGPIPATKKVLQLAKLDIKQIDRYELNEAFCTVPLSWKKAVGADMEKLNVNGGAMALGHPLGATGTKLVTTLLHELERCNGRYGVLAICEGGGTANATVFERITDQARL